MLTTRDILMTNPALFSFFLCILTLFHEMLIPNSVVISVG